MKQKILSVALFLCLMVGVLSCLSLEAKAYSTGDDYPNEYKSQPIDAVVDRWNFYNRECTSFTAWCLNSRNGVNFTNQYLGGYRWGHAYEWGGAARSRGILVDMNPAVGAVAWSDAYAYGSGWAGHVAWVKAVRGDYVDIEEYNWSPGSFTSRTIHKNNVSGYIHIKDISPIPTPTPPPVPTVVFAPWSQDGYTKIEEEDAWTGQRIDVANGTCTETGMYLRDESGQRLASAKNDSYDNAYVYFKIKEECKYTLKPGTTYKYQFYAVVNGKTYLSGEASFKTKGTATATISLSVSPIGAGLASGGGTIKVGDKVRLEASPTNGYRFKEWTENGRMVSEDSIFEFTAAADRNLVAVFEKGDPLPVTVKTLPTASAIEYGQQVMDSTISGGTVVAPDGKVVSGSWLWNDSSFQPTESGMFTALFIPSNPQRYALTDAKIFISVKNAPVLTNIYFAKKKEYLTPGQTMKLAVLSNLTGSYTGQLEWRSDNAGVAQVDGQGNVTGLKNGNAVIRASTLDGKHTASCTVIVGPWYQSAVDFVQEEGLMNGYSNGSFGPNDKLTRAQLAQILYNKAGKPSVTVTNRFADVRADDWYGKAVSWAAEQKIVNGYGNGKFGHGDRVTRQDLAAMLWRYAGSPSSNGNVLDFPDANKISSYAEEAMRWAVDKKIMSGSGGKLNPRGYATRAQAAQMLKNYFGK